MNPLNGTASSLNVERNQVDAAVAASGQSAGEGPSVFGDLMRGLAALAAGMGVSAGPGPVEAASGPSGRPADPVTDGAGANKRPAATASPAAPEPERAEHAPRGQKPVARESRAADGTDQPAGDRDKPAVSDANPADMDNASTLAHWLIGVPVARPMAGDPVPPPANAAGVDETGAAAITRDLLRGLRATAGQPGAGGAAAALAAGQQAAAAADAAVSASKHAGDDAKASGHWAAALAQAGAGAEAASSSPTAPTLAPEAVASTTDATGSATAVSPLLGGSVTPAVPLVADVTVATPVGAPGFAEDVANAVHGMTLSHRDGIHEARLQLNPAELGPVQVRIEVVDGTARVDLAAAHATTRQLLEASLPALADALKADGLALSAGTVSDWQAGATGGELTGQGGNARGGPGGGANGQQPHGDRAGTWWRGAAESAAPAAGTPAAAWTTARPGGLDLYA